MKKDMLQKRVLIIDDDESVTQMLKMLLETRGYIVDIALCREEALKKVSSSTDLVLLDLVLPDGEGFEVCRSMKEATETKGVPIIIVSGKFLSKDIVEGLYLGADDYLTKPFDYEELIARMETVIRRRDALSPKQNKDLSNQYSVVSELRKIVDNELIVPFFQPVFNLDPFSLLGFEALSRPQSKTMLQNPDALFKAAVQFGFYQELEIISWKKAMLKIEPYLENKKLFLNCNPYLVEGSEFLNIKNSFDKYNVPINQVVLEITERSAVSDSKLFYRNLNEYKDSGFSFAVDDVGGGYAGIETILQIKPQVIKIDRGIVSLLHKDKFKRSLVRCFLSFCKENDILCIAEGIETKEELDTVISLGVDAGQGYFLCKPIPEINLDELNVIGRKLFK